MKKWICLVLLLFLLPLAVSAEDGGLPPEVEAQLDKPGITAGEFQQAGLGQLLAGLWHTAKEQLAAPARLFARLLGTALLGAAALALAPGDWSRPLETVCALAVFAVALDPVLALVTAVSGSISQWQAYLVSFVPVFSGVTASCGQPTQALVYSGMFLTMANVSAQAIRTMALPVLQVYLALGTAGSLCAVEGVKEGGELLAKAVRWLLGLLSVFFGAVLGLQTILARNTDDLAMRTGQFLLSTGIPVVGGLASDAMGSVLSALKVVKGSLGFAAIAVLAVSFVPVLLQCAFCYLACQLSGAAAKAFGLGRAGGALEGMAQGAGLCAAFLVFFFLLVVVATALMIAVGGGG